MDSPYLHRAQTHIFLATLVFISKTLLGFPSDSCATSTIVLKHGTVTDSTLQLFCNLVSNNNLRTQLLLNFFTVFFNSYSIKKILKKKRIFSNSMDMPRNCYASGYLSCSIIKLSLSIVKILLSLGQNAS